MKVLCAVFVVLCAVSYAQAIDKEQAMAMAKQLLTACKEKEGGSDADFEQLIKFDLPSTHEGSCMIACAHEKMGIHDNGNFLKDNFLGLAKVVTDDDPKIMPLAQAVADKCGAIGGARCDQAIEFSRCMEAEAKALNIPKPNMI